MTLPSPDRLRLATPNYYASADYQAHTLIQLIDGQKVMGMAPTPRHQDIVGEAYLLLRAIASSQGGKVYLSPIEVELDDYNVFEPDLVYLKPDTRCRVEDKRLVGPPSLVIEVLSPSTARHDRQQKFDAYEAHGVGEYWIIDPLHQTLEAWASEAGGFVKRGTFGPGERYICPLLGAAPIALSLILGLGA